VFNAKEESNMAANQFQFCMCLSAPNPGAQKDYRAAILKNARWQPGNKITIRFLGGDPALQQRVKNVALEWTKVANLVLDFVNQGPTDIRVAFAPGNGSWSYIGTVCQSIPEPQPTMNYGWLTSDSEEAEVRRVVLHEFGHALGLIHEHQNPKGGIQWNKPAVIRDLSGPPNNWDQATIDNNMFRYYPLTDVIPTDVDAQSIMMYPIPRAWTIDGFSAGLNGELSANDKTLVASVYPI
jgi:serralysin